VATLGKNIVQQTPYNLNNTKSKTISVINLIDTVDTGKIVGKGYRGRACLPTDELRWIGNEKVIFELTNKVRVQLSKYGYSLVGEVNSLFNDEISRKSELLLSGKIIDVQANVCMSGGIAKGEIYIKVEWQVFNNKTKEVILSLHSEGIMVEREFYIDGFKVIFYKAFNQALDNLLAEKEFYTLLMNEH